MSVNTKYSGLSPYCSLVILWLLWIFKTLGICMSTIKKILLVEQIVIPPYCVAKDGDGRLCTFKSFLEQTAPNKRVTSTFINKKPTATTNAE